MAVRALRANSVTEHGPAPSRLRIRTRLGVASACIVSATTRAVSLLRKAGYHIKQIQEYLGHADLVTTGRYIKNLPVPRGNTAREKLEAYLAAEIGHLEP